MTDAERLRFEVQGRALVRRYGQPREVAAMEARVGPPVERPATSEAQAEAFRMRQFGLGVTEIARRIGKKVTAVQMWFARAA